MANRVLAILRALYRWALIEDQKRFGVTVDATAGLKRPHVEDAAPRVYTPDELRALFASAHQITGLREALPFLAFTMARLGEALGARWPEIDFAEKVWTVPAARSKDGRPHIVPLSARCVELLQDVRDSRRIVSIGSADDIFPGAGAAVSSEVRERWRALSGVADAAFHPFRDTAAAELRELGYSSDVREDLLSHTPPKLHRAYQGEYRTSLAERRRAIEAWGERLTEILAAKPLEQQA